MYSSILHGLLTGFLFPLVPFFFFRDPPVPNFFDADAEVREVRPALAAVIARVTSSPDVGGESISSVVFGKRMQVGTNSSSRFYNRSDAEIESTLIFSQMGILLGTVINVAFGWLRFLN